MLTFWLFPVVEQLFLTFANSFQSSESRFQSAMLTCNFRIKKRLIVLCVHSSLGADGSQDRPRNNLSDPGSIHKSDISLNMYMYCVCIYIYPCMPHTYACKCDVHIICNTLTLLFFLTLICICLKFLISKIKKKKVFNRLLKISHLHLLHLAQLSSPDLV